MLELLRANAGPDFRTIFEQEFDYVWSTLRRLGVAERDLEDVVHETFLRIHAKLHECDTTTSLRPWLFAFAFRMASDYRRLARNRMEVIGVDPEIAESGQAPDAEAERRESLALVSRALDALDEHRRAVFVLHELEERPIPEVAAILSIPLNTAYSRLRLAREEFSAAFTRVLEKKPGRP
jgi:RNA polymerase sigma-70 factor (ECF subfamily)